MRKASQRKNNHLNKLLSCCHLGGLVDEVMVVSDGAAMVVAEVE
jgi:hypothetical protein